MDITEDVFYYNVVPFLNIREIHHVMLSGNKSRKPYLQNKIENMNVVSLLSEPLKELLEYIETYDIDTPTSGKSAVIGKKTIIPYLKLTIYLTEGTLEEINNRFITNIGDYQKEELILMNNGEYMSNGYVDECLELSDFYGQMGYISKHGMNKLKELVQNHILDIPDKYIQGRYVRIKFL